MTEKTFEKIKKFVKQYGYREGLRITFHRHRISNEIRDFKANFRNKDIHYSPEARMLFTMFGHNDIDKLNLKELSMLGFNSANTWREDYDTF